ncbi:MAG: nucleotidyltransferase domain-containing protein [Eubacterium sp.]|nr:nucleotidyltransferase domain-containing protein [Eubacterium sp.]
MPVEELNRISGVVSPVAQKYGVTRVFLFGSRARGDDNTDSDYDFLISKGDINTLLKYAAFIDELEEQFGTKVDVVLYSV